MILYVTKRALQALMVIFVMVTLVFFAIYAIGNPVDALASPQADQRELDRITERLGLDQPILHQYGLFLWNAVQGDLGRSFVYDQSALGLVFSRLPATLELAFMALLLAVVLGVPLGIYAGLRPDSVGAKSVMAGSIVGFSLPSFWQGLMLILIFAVTLGWLPAGGRGTTGSIFGIQSSFATLNGITHLVLPALNLALFKIALVIRVARAGTREAMLQDYIRFARAKGLSPARIVSVHLLKNILIPIVTVLGLEFGSLVAFAVVTETVFAYPGMGKLLIDSIGELDRPVVVAYLIVTVVVFVTVNFVVDLLYSAIDPRVTIGDRV